MENFKIQLAGENALMIYFSDQASDSVAAVILQAQQLIRHKMMNEKCHVVIDLVSSYASLMVMFDMRLSDHHEVRNQLRSILNTINLPTEQTHVGSLSNVTELPVYYSNESGPDLHVIAKRASLTIEQVIEIHQAQAYRVYAIGFAPGFAYLGEVDARIATPRLSTPRMKVPKGAVAIADRQTAVYPSVSPGGWNIIGLCPTDMFDPKADPIMPVQVGDIVKFKAINKEVFLALGGVVGEFV